MEAVPAADQVHARVDVLIERGLEKYGQGDLLGALCEWEHALTLEPGAARASEYIDYVRANFDLLERQFKLAQEIAANSAAAGVPIPDVPEEVSGAYELIELQRGNSSAPKSIGPTPARIDSPIDTGWDIFEVAAPLPPPPQPAPPPGPGLEEDLAGISRSLEPVAPVAEAEEIAVTDSMTLEVGVDDMLTPPPGLVAETTPPPEAASGPSAETSRPSVDDDITVPGGEPPPPLPERPAFAPEALEILGGRPSVVTILPRGEGTSPGELPAPPQAATPPELDLELGALDASVSDDRALPDEQTVAPPPSVHLSDVDTDEEAGTSERQPPVAPEDLPTLERSAGAAGAASDEADFPELEFGEDFEDGSKTRERGPSAGALPDAGAGGPNVIVDAMLLSTPSPSPVARAADLSDDEDDDGDRTRDLTAESAEHRARVRVNELIALAREAADRGDYLAAVEAVEAAASEDREGLIAPVILHRHRDLLFRIYEGHIGEMTQVPLVAVPLHAIAAEHLDHRTGFLLSRIDGLLTYEDILDVAGMPRMEAYKILSGLLRKGFIEVRQGS